MTKFALVSYTLPPVSSGQGVALYRILVNLPLNSYCLISQRKYGDNLTFQNNKSTSEASIQHVPTLAKGIKKSTDFLPVNYYHCPQIKQIKRGASWLARLRLLQAVNFPIGLHTLPDYVDAIEALLKLEKCSAVVACSGSLWDIPAAYEASKRLGIKFHAYYFDWWLYQFYWYKEISFARKKEAIILKNATKVLVPNESLANSLRNRYSIEPVIIRNPCDLSSSKSESDSICDTDNIIQPVIASSSMEKIANSTRKSIRILYTGAIYGAQSDAIKNLLKALELINEYDIKLVVYTTVPQTILKLKGISGKVEIYGHLSSGEIRLAQQKADLLLLPLSFTSHYNKEVIMTASPGKMSDYLASGRPILVHAPENSFIAKFFSDHDCGLVITKREPNTLATEIINLLKDESKCEHFVKNAMNLAVKEFDSKIVSDKFFRSVTSNSSS